MPAASLALGTLVSVDSKSCSHWVGGSCRRLSVSAQLVCVAFEESEFKAANLRI